MCLVLGRMAAESGKLPSEVVFGTAAMAERTEWHLAFDFAVMTRRWAAIQAELDRKAPASSRRRGRRGTGVNLPDPV